jgi:hypothetical protein
VNDASLHNIRSSRHSEARRNGIAGSGDPWDGQQKFEDVLRGLRIVFILIFVPSLILGAFIFLVAALFPIQSHTPSGLAPNNCWRDFLSISVRVGLIPGLVVLIYRITRRRRNSQSNRFLAIFLSVLLISVFAFVPFQQRARPIMKAFSLRHRQIEPASLKSKAARVGGAMHPVSKLDTWNDLPEQESRA